MFISVGIVSIPLSTTSLIRQIDENAISDPQILMVHVATSRAARLRVRAIRFWSVLAGFAGATASAIEIPQSIHALSSPHPTFLRPESIHSVVDYMVALDRHARDNHALSHSNPAWFGHQFAQILFVIGVIIAFTWRSSEEKYLMAQDRESRASRPRTPVPTPTHRHKQTASSQRRTSAFGSRGSLTVPRTSLCAGSTSVGNPPSGGASHASGVLDSGACPALIDANDQSESRNASSAPAARISLSDTAHMCRQSMSVSVGAVERELSLKERDSRERESKDSKDRRESKEESKEGRISESKENSTKDRDSMVKESLSQSKERGSKEVKTLDDMREGESVVSETAETVDGAAAELPGVIT